MCRRSIAASYFEYAAQFPLPVKQQIVEAPASFNSAQLHP
jgi:hypothetical protein